MTFDHVTVVLQGLVKARPVSPEPPLGVVVESIRTHLPGAKIVVSTWENAEVPPVEVDQVVRSVDPGPLPAVKRSTSALNNVNRQITSTRAGLDVVRTKYALKMRTDCVLRGHGFVELQRSFPARDAKWALFRERVVVANLYSINPRVLEHVPFHVSDWFQFGRTEDLADFWAGPFMAPADATWFDHHPHRAGSTPSDRDVIPRYAVEQFLTLSYVRRTRTVPCEYLNDTNRVAMSIHDRVLANNFVIAELGPAGFGFPKNDWAASSWFHRVNCYTHTDWRGLYARYALGRRGLASGLVRGMVLRAVGLLGRSRFRALIYEHEARSKLLRWVPRRLRGPGQSHDRAAPGDVPPTSTIDV